MRSRSLLALLLVFLGALPAVDASSATLERLDASVNASMILLSDVRDFRRTVGMRAQVDPLFAGTPLAEQGAKASDSDITEFLIDEAIVSQQFPAEDKEVEQKINEIQADNKLDRAGMRALIAEQGYSFEDYWDLIRISLSKRALIERDIRIKVNVSDEDVRNHYVNRFGGQMQARSFHVKIIRLSTGSFKTRTALIEAAKAALAAVRGGEAFEEVAKRASDDDSAKSGGDLGMLTEDQMNPLVRETMKKLRPGDVSELLGSADAGYFILKLADVKTDVDSRFDKVKEDIRNQLTTAEYQHQISLWIERQRQVAFIHRHGQASTEKLPSRPAQSNDDE